MAFKRSASYRPYAKPTPLPQTQGFLNARTGLPVQTQEQCTVAREDLEGLVVMADRIGSIAERLAERVEVLLGVSEHDIAGTYKFTP